VWSGILWPFSTLAVAERFNATDVTTKEEAMIYLSEFTSVTFSNFNILPTTVHEIGHYYLPSIKNSYGYGGISIKLLKNCWMLY